MHAWRLSFPVKTFAALLVAVALAVCVVDIVQAAMPGGEMPDCAGRVCDMQFACGASTQAQALQTSPTVPAAILPVVETLAVPTQASDSAAAAPLDVGPDRQIAPLAPRSPPVIA
jgi:hypothetical protein